MSFAWWKHLGVCSAVVVLVAAQWPGAAAPRKLPPTPHAPLADCALHDCGCDPGKSSRQNCCCLPAREPQPLRHERRESVWRTAQCAGTDAAPLTAAGKLQFVCPVLHNASVPLHESAHTAAAPDIATGRTCEPPDPPPELLAV